MNAPVIFVGNRRGERGDGQMVREGQDNEGLLHYFSFFNIYSLNGKIAFSESRKVHSYIFPEFPPKGLFSEPVQITEQ